MQVTSEARVRAVGGLETAIGLTADHVGATAEVVRGGAPVTAVGSAELVAGQGGAAHACGSITGRANGDVNVGAAADGGVLGVGPAAGVAHARVLVREALLAVT